MTAHAPRVRIEPLDDGAGPALGAFATDLRTGTGPGLAFLDAMPASGEAWKAALLDAVSSVNPVDPELAATLAARQVALGAGERAAAGAALLGEPGTVAIVTGQQPGLFGGPLLTMHKVAGAIDLARRLDGIGGVRVVPVFWTATEDHDFDEANRAGVLDARGQARTLRMDASGDGRSILDLGIDDEVREGVLAALREALPDTDRAREALALARTHPGENVGRWSVRTLLRVFGDSGLVVVEPETLWPWSGPTLAWMLDHAETLREHVAATGEALRAAGLPAPIEPSAGMTGIFWREAPGSRRLRVEVEGERVTTRDTEFPGGRAAFRDALLAHEGRACGNVMGRVFIQNAHLPILAYIAGPSEIAYQAQLRAAAGAVGVRFPLALPRPEATWVDAKTRQLAEGFELSVGALLRGASPSLEGPAEDAAGLRAALDTWLEAWPEDLAEREASGGRTGAALGRLRDTLQTRAEKMWSSVASSVEADAGVGRGRLERLHAALLPGGAPQERWLSPLSLIARHGLDAVREGLLSIDSLVPAHQLVHLEPV